MIEIPLQSNGNRLVGGRFFLKTNEDMVWLVADDFFIIFKYSFIFNPFFIHLSFFFKTSDGLGWLSGGDFFIIFILFIHLFFEKLSKFWVVVCKWLFIIFYYIFSIHSSFFNQSRFSSNNIYLIMKRLLAWLDNRKYKQSIFHYFMSLKNRGNVPSLPNLALGDLPSTVLAALPAAPAPAVQPPPRSGRHLLPLQKWLQSLRSGIVPELGQCRSSKVFCIALLSPPAGTQVQVSLLTDTSVPHGSQHK